MLLLNLNKVQYYSFGNIDIKIWKLKCIFVRGDNLSQQSGSMYFVRGDNLSQQSGSYDKACIF
jgi:hypothetical protein